jgi:EpsI family protein
MRRFVITISVLILAIVAAHLPSSPEPVLSRTSLEEFPSRIGDWVLLNKSKMDAQSMAVLQVDDYIIRTYANSKGETVSLYIGYFKTQREGKTNHSPRLCLPGAGWSTLTADSLMLDVSAAKTGQIPANSYLMQKGDVKELFLFWYHGRGRQISSEYMTKAYLIWDSITRNRTDGALIRINALASPNPDKAFREETEFIRSFYPMLSRYIPD